MNVSIQEIAAEILTLPEQEQQEVVDFVGFLKTKLAHRQVKRYLANPEGQVAQQTEGARVLQVLDEYGLIGCMKGCDGKLSEDYKQHLWGNE
jgi:hypothetical protein